MLKTILGDVPGILSELSEAGAEQIARCMNQPQKCHALPHSKAQDHLLVISLLASGNSTSA